MVDVYGCSVRVTNGTPQLERSCAMKTIHTFVVVLLTLAVALTGCGESPSTPPPTGHDAGSEIATNDAGCSGSDCVDAGLPTDVSSPVDSGSGNDASVTTDTGPVCRPTITCPTNSANCCTGRLCEPANGNATCAGATECQCNTTMDMDQMCPRGSLPDCRMAVARIMSEELSCVPGSENRCSPNTNSAWQYFWLEPEALGYNASDEYWYVAGRRLDYVITRGWHIDDRSENPGSSFNRGCGFRYTTSLNYSNGFLSLCLHGDMDDRMGLDTNGEYRMDCVGRTCSWNRRPALAAVNPSAELTWTRDPSPDLSHYCEARLRVWAASAAQPRYDHVLSFDCRDLPGL